MLIFAIYLIVVFQIVSAKFYNSTIIMNNDSLTLNQNITITIEGIQEIIKAIPIDRIAIVHDNNTDIVFINKLTQSFQLVDIAVQIFNIDELETFEVYFDFLWNSYVMHESVNCLYFVQHSTAEEIILELKTRNLIHRYLLYIFYWGSEPISKRFKRTMHEAMKMVVLTNPRSNVFRVYYNQATSNKKYYLKLVNWWIKGRDLYHRPTLPSAQTVYKDFHGRIFRIPVVHKPPWHFVKYDNNSENIIVEGGRDDKLLAVIAEKLNFRYLYFDPPDRSQGSSILTNGTFYGVLGLIWQREVAFFLGDVAITLERSFAVEFSFLTLADSGAFLTHSPSRLNEAFALVRPFHWEVWPLVFVTVIISGPVLYTLIALPTLWNRRHHFIGKSQHKLLNDCMWFTTTIFLRQIGKTPDKTFPARLFTIIVSISATYVIGDMYSANLTSLLARPGRDKREFIVPILIRLKTQNLYKNISVEKPINTLTELEETMKNQDYQLYVERHSSSHTILENATGIYGRLWNLMQRQDKYLIDSVEIGVKAVRNSKNIAVIAGRETLFFDSRRFGANHFHLSEKLYTGYSAIAFQIGCPYIENFNKILMKLFEAGILLKMTEEEYEKLGKKQLQESSEASEENDNKNTNSGSNQDNNNPSQSSGSLGTQSTIIKKAAVIEEEQKSKPISLSMLQGAFYILISGNLIAAVTFASEIFLQRKQNIKRKSFTTNKRKLIIPKWYKFCRNYIQRKCIKMQRWYRDKLQEAINDVAFDSLEYLE